MTILIYSVPFAGILQLALLWRAAEKAGFKINLADQGYQTICEYW